MKIRELTIGALLTAMAIVIPIIFAPFRIVLGPFTGTPASHLPMFLSMLISPTTALMVGVGSVIGFLFTATPVVAARAASHIITGFFGALLIKKGVSMAKAFFIVLPVHAILEAIVVIPFGWTAYKILVGVGIGTALHHGIDAAIALSIAYALKPLLKLNTVRS